MVRRRRIANLAVLAVVPVHASAVDDDPPDGRTVTTDPFRGRFDDNIRAQLQRLANVATTTEGVIANQRNPVFFGDGFHAFKIWNQKRRVPESLDVQSLRVSIDQLFKARRVFLTGEFHVNP